MMLLLTYIFKVMGRIFLSQEGIIFPQELPFLKSYCAVQKAQKTRARWKNQGRPPERSPKRTETKWLKC